MTSAPPPAPPPTVDPPAWQPPPPPPGPPYPAQLRRSRGNKIIGGVAGGLAEYSGVDALLWRVGFVALTFAGGSGILVYLLLWLLMPAGPPVGAGEAEGWAHRRQERVPAGPRSPVPGVTIAGLLILIGVLVLLTNFTAWDIGPRGFLGTALLVVGAGLVAAAFSQGRTAKGGLIALGALLSVALIGASSGPWHDGSRVGDVVFTPENEYEVLPRYEGGVGDMTLDLTRIELGALDGPIATQVHHGLGDVRIVLPRDADIRLSVDNGLGSVDVLGEGARGGGFFAGTGTGSWVDDGNPEFDLVVHNGLGDVEVSRG
jgi:phage shock protein PspC (stress-responsive transcriptional regulator)